MLYNFCMIMFLRAKIKQNKFEDQYHLLHNVCCLFIDKMCRSNNKKTVHLQSAYYLPTTQLPEWQSKRIFFSLLKSRSIVKIPRVNFNLNFLTDVIKNIILSVKNLI